jgi:hypothetical protein
MSNAKSGVKTRFVVIMELVILLGSPVSRVVSETERPGLYPFFLAAGST